MVKIILNLLFYYLIMINWIPIIIISANNANIIKNIKKIF